MQLLVGELQVNCLGAVAQTEAGRVAPGIGMTWSPLASIQASTTWCTDVPWSLEICTNAGWPWRRTFSVANAAERAPRQERNAEPAAVLQFALAGAKRGGELVL